MAKAAKQTTTKVANEETKKKSEIDVSHKIHWKISFYHKKTLLEYIDKVITMFFSAFYINFE